MCIVRSYSVEIEHREQLRPGTVFLDRYEVIRCIRTGGMGSVYEVHDRNTQRNRALKTMLPTIADDPDLCARFRQEATIAAHIDSEHIVDVLDAGIDESSGLLFLVMELLKGADLESQLNKSGLLSREATLEILRQLVRVLDKTHAADVVHRDLKPANLFVTTRDDGSPRLRVLDFGIAKVIAQGSIAQTTLALGTPVYMSPEQIHGDRNIGPQSDLYAVGQIVFTLLVGHAYFERELVQSPGVAGLLYRVLQGTREPATTRAASWGASLPGAFDAWFARATASEPAQRFASGKELYEALAAALGPERDVAHKEATRAPNPPPNDSTNPPGSTRNDRYVGSRRLTLAGIGLVLLTTGLAYRASRRATIAPAAAREPMAAVAAAVPSGNEREPIASSDAGSLAPVPIPAASANAATLQDKLRPVRKPVIMEPTPFPSRPPRSRETPADPTDIR